MQKSVQFSLLGDMYMYMYEYREECLMQFVMWYTCTLGDCHLGLRAVRGLGSCGSRFIHVHVNSCSTQCMQFIARLKNIFHWPSSAQPTVVYVQLDIFSLLSRVSYVYDTICIYILQVFNFLNFANLEPFTNYFNEIFETPPTKCIINCVS